MKKKGTSPTCIPQPPWAAAAIKMSAHTPVTGSHCQKEQYKSYSEWQVKTLDPFLKEGYNGLTLFHSNGIIPSVGAASWEALSEAFKDKNIDSNSLGLGITAGTSNRQTEKPEKKKFRKGDTWVNKDFYKLPTYTKGLISPRTCPGLDICSEKAWEEPQLSHLVEFQISL